MSDYQPFPLWTLPMSWAFTIVVCMIVLAIPAGTRRLRKYLKRRGRR